MSRKFIVTADDYGVSPIIDEAVKQAVRMGIVTSVACFANKRDDNNNFTMQSVRELKNEFSDVEIGCHFTITSGDWMATTGSDLGRKHGKSPKFRRKAWQHPERAIKDDTLPVPGDELVDELTAQVEAFRQEGIKIAHFSDHMGILSYTRKGMEAMITVINNYNQAEGLNSPMRNPIFISRVPNLNGTCLKKSTMSARGALGAGIKALLQRNKWENISLRATRLNRQLEMVNTSGIQSTDYLIESYYGSASRARLKCIHRNAPNNRYKTKNPISASDVTSEIMVHLAVAPGDGVDVVDYETEVKRLKKHGGVAVNYLKKKRIEEFEILKQHFSSSFPASELGNFNH